MKIIEILPELEIGGVERHVIDLSNELAERGHDVLVISAGGQMQAQLSKKVEHRSLPVHKKNPFTGWFCAKKISKWIKNEKYQLLHAHSRVPAWIADWASGMSGVPYLVTAHVDFGNKSRWIYRPYREAARVICVSHAVCNAMKNVFSNNTEVVLNGLDTPSVTWSKPDKPPVKFLFVGRLSEVKGLQDALRAMPQNGDWTLDVLGDGPIMDELKKITQERDINEKVYFHGYVDSKVVDEYMSRSSCLLFPSYTEGMPLTLARAVQIGIPVIASNIEPVAEMAGSRDGLLAPGDINAWGGAIRDFISNETPQVRFEPDSVPTLAKMVDRVEEIYREILE